MVGFWPIEFERGVMNGCDSFWFGVQVKPRHEITVATILRNKGYEEFVPLYREKRKWSDRQKTVLSPLFRGYIFCRFNAEIKAPIVTTPGVIRIIGSRQEPLPIDEKEIHAIQAVVESGLPAEPHPWLPIGSRVVINEGPLAGIEGLLTDYKNKHIVLSVNLVQQSISIEADAGSFTAIPPQYAPSTAPA